MSNPFVSLPASLWPAGSLIPPFNPGQGTFPPPAPAAAPEWPSLVLDDTTPGADEVLRHWAGPQAFGAESPPLGAHELPHPAAEFDHQTLADAKRQNDLMAWLAQTALALQWVQAQSRPPAAMQSAPFPAAPTGAGQAEPAAPASEPRKAD